MKLRVGKLAQRQAARIERWWREHLVPQLAKDAGDHKRAKVEVRRMAMLSSE